MQLHPITVTDGVSISYDSCNKWLYVDWKGEHDNATSYAACALILAALRQQPCGKILNDNSNISYTTAELSQWGKEWLQDMVAAGLQYFAWVLPRHSTKLEKVNLNFQSMRGPLVVTFSDVATAFDWLHQQQWKL